MMFPQLFNVLRVNTTFIIKFIFIAEFEYIYIDSKDVDVTDATFDVLNNTYELLFFISHKLFGKIKLSKKSFVSFLDVNITLESLNDTIFFEKIYAKYFMNIKEWFKKSVELLYLYTEKHQSAECLPDMDDILKRCDELDCDAVKMRLGLSKIYDMIQESLLKFSET